VEINVTLERAVPRSLSYSLGESDPRVSILSSSDPFSTYSDVRILQQKVRFTDRVRTRDQCCVVSGTEVPNQDFTGLHAAHIFPFAHLDLVCILLQFLVYVSSNSISQWRSGQWSQMIEDDEPDIGNSKIHSIQNGILLSGTVRSYFDKYKIAINPDVRVFTSGHKMILMVNRTTIKSPVLLETLLALMVGTWSSETVPSDISLFELSSNTTFTKLCYVI
jgi:hypothetical protein